MGTAPLSSRRSSSAGCACRERLATQRMMSFSERLMYASTFWFAMGRNSMLPRPKTRNCLRSRIMLRIQCQSEELSRLCAATLTVATP